MINCLKDPAYVLMRVLPCKIHCPSFICFCKPTPHIYAATGPLKLENTPPQVSSTTVASANGDDSDGRVDVDHVDGNGDEVEEESTVDGHEEVRQVSGGNCLKSSLRKSDSNSADADSRKKKKKKKVQWVDSTGKELAEIKEFEPSELEEIGYDGGRSCVCVIL